MMSLMAHFNWSHVGIELAMCFAASWVLVAMLLHVPDSSSRVPLLKEGEIAPRTVRAAKTVDIESVEEAESQKQEVLQKVPQVYDFDSQAVRAWAEKWKLAIRSQRSFGGRQKLQQDLGQAVSAADYAMFKKIGFGRELESSIGFALAPLWDARIVESASLPPTGVEIVDLTTGATQVLSGGDSRGLLSADEARALVSKAATYQARSQSDARRLPWTLWPLLVREAVFNMQSRLVSPNVTPNKKESEKRRSVALKEWRAPTLRIQKGEVVVRTGDKVSHRSAFILSQMAKGDSSKARPGRILFQGLFLGCALWIFYRYLIWQFPKAIQRKKDAWVTLLVLVGSIAFFKIAAVFQIEIVAEQFQSVPGEFFLFLIPVAAPAMIMRLLVGNALSALFSAMYALGCAVVLDGFGAYSVFALLTCLLGGSFLRRCRTRTELFRAGVKTALVGGALGVILVVGVGQSLAYVSLRVGDVQSPSSMLELIVWSFLGAAVGGWLASAMTLIVTPILENVLDYTTELKLLELARMDHPLLRELVLKAPGTYHHSIVVGSLAEAACEAVKANALLTRVGAYYHDIGKIPRAEYFVENQTRGVNPHDQAKPALSAKIIISHVKEGKTLADQFGLGSAITDFILQHHGTSLVTYFYNKAKHEAAQPGSSIKPSEIREDEFRYPGPKPQSKESAILALADSCEAATRSLVEPTPARIEGMVSKIVSRAFSEGLLEEADITLREVGQVEKAFVRILLGIHHNRIQYPDQEQGLPRPKTLAFMKPGAE